MELVKYIRVQWDRSGAVAATVLGLLVLFLGYLGTSGTEYIAEQIPYLVSGGLVGIALLTIGAVLWLSADLRDEWRQMAEQGEAIREEQLERRSQLTAHVETEVARQVALALAIESGRARRPRGSRRTSAASADRP